MAGMKPLHTLRCVGDKEYAHERVRAADPIWTDLPPDEAWLARQAPEPILDPDLPIIDPHHHLWDRPQHRYLLDDFLADVRTGHHLVATVFEECHSMYRASGPEELRSVGETEFVAGVAAMSASGLYGPTRVAAGIVGFADLTLGDRVEPVLGASPGQRRTVPRCASFGGLGRQPGDRQQPHGHRAACAAAAGLPDGSGPVDRARPLLGRLGISSPARRRHRPGQGLPHHAYHPVPCGRAARLWSLCRQGGRGVRGLADQDHHTGHMRERGRETGRDAQSAGRLRLPGPPGPGVLDRAGGVLAPLHGDLHRTVRRRPLHVREQFPRGKDGVGWATLWNAFKRIAEGASAAEKLALFSGTARRVYRLD